MLDGPAFDVPSDPGRDIELAPAVDATGSLCIERQDPTVGFEATLPLSGWVAPGVRLPGSGKRRPRLLGLSTPYAPLLSVMVIGPGPQAALPGILNALFSIDRLRLALLLAVCVLGLFVLDCAFERLAYETFMLQPGA